MEHHGNFFKGMALLSNFIAIRIEMTES